jgi:hypothetical protein
MWLLSGGHLRNHGLRDEGQGLTMLHGQTSVQGPRSWDEGQAGTMEAEVEESAKTERDGTGYEPGATHKDRQHTGPGCSGMAWAPGSQDQECVAFLKSLHHSGNRDRWVALQTSL